MGKETIVVRFCDNCKSSTDVHDLTVVYDAGTGFPWEADLCKACYEAMLGALRKKGREAEVKSLRPRHKFHKTEVTADML